VCVCFASFGSYTSVCVCVSSAFAVVCCGCHRVCMCACACALCVFVCLCVCQFVSRLSAVPDDVLCASLHGPWKSARPSQTSRHTGRLSMGNRETTSTGNAFCVCHGGMRQH